TELIDTLPPEADSAITSLVDAGGRLPWTTFTRKYGEIREAGAGKRDREKLYRNPNSTTETLYYRGLIARAFFDTEKGPQEFTYIPDDLFSIIKNKRTIHESPPQRTHDEPLGRPASPGERGQETLSDDSLLDDATTLLAALRMRRSGFQPDNKLTALLTSAKLIKKTTIQTEAVKTFLEASRSDALSMLQDEWLESETFNELKLMPGIICEGEWANQPLETREFLLSLLDAIPEGKWWSLNTFIRDIKTKYADFQRPASDYDSWFIKRASDGQYLRGFAYWDSVDGALIKYFITDILYWLGQVDLSIAEGASEPTAFRLSSFDGVKDEKGRISVASNGKISVERTAPRAVRYQISRFCEWDEMKGDAYQFHITTNSLTKAKEQGLKPEHLLALLVKHTNNKVPPALVKALKRWEVNGTEARVETQVILRLSKPEVLEEMRKSKAARFLGEVLSPTAVVVKSGAIQKVMDALAELGLLTEIVSSE
ncbi:MAG TPA: helicase-associated domain-containing protein, partial [Anaerolineales bacterium]